MSYLHDDTGADVQTPTPQSFRGTRTGEAEGVSEDARKKAEAAKSYIENLYKSKESNRQSRDERCVSAQGVHAKTPSHSKYALEVKLRDPNLSDTERRALLQEFTQLERDYTRLQRQRLSADDFEPLTIIGRGAFGEVRIVREKATNKVLAMKKLKKAEMVRRGQVRMRLRVCALQFFTC